MHYISLYGYGTEKSSRSKCENILHIITLKMSSWYLPLAVTQH